MILNHLKVLLTLDPKYCVSLKQFIYTNIYTPHISTKDPPVPISHELANMFKEMPVINGSPIKAEDDDDEMSLATSTPRSCIRNKALQ